jgi:sulfofructose kinase
MADIERVDVVGLGLNATDTIIRLPEFPQFDSKLEMISHDVRAGGQAASAMVACRRWGLSARYIGKIGEDWAGDFQLRELETDGVESHLFRVGGCQSQRAYILVDEATGERTILWNRDARLEIRPEELRREWITSASALILDGHDTAAAIQAARWAREAGMPVVLDIDKDYPGLQVLLENTDYIISSREFPLRISGEGDLLKALRELHAKFKCRLMGATLGKLGVVIWDGRRFFYARGFEVRAIDTTGAGDIFHAAFLFGLVKGWDMERILEFSCAAAAFACGGVGARGGIAPLAEIEHLISSGRRSAFAYEERDLARAACD